MKTNEVVRTYKHKKVVRTFVDEDTGDELYEHIGTGKGGFEWHTGVFVVVRGNREERKGEENVYRTN